MGNYNYLRENSPVRKIKGLVFFILVSVIFLFLVFLVYKSWNNIIQTTPIVNKVMVSLKYNLVNTTPIGLFYGHFIGGIFFVPSADELIFYYGLLSGNPPLFSFFAALTGYMLAQILNYLAGSKMSTFILHIVSKKKVYRTKRWINKYGAYGVFFFNITPLPAPLLTFALGVTKYNFRRLFIIMILAKSLEYLILVGSFLLFSA